MESDPRDVVAEDESARNERFAELERVDAVCAMLRKVELRDRFENIDAVLCRHIAAERTQRGGDDERKSSFMCAHVIVKKTRKEKKRKKRKEKELLFIISE